MGFPSKYVLRGEIENYYFYFHDLILGRLAVGIVSKGSIVFLFNVLPHNTLGATLNTYNQNWFREIEIPATPSLFLKDKFKFEVLLFGHFVEITEHGLIFRPVFKPNPPQSIYLPTSVK